MALRHAPLLLALAASASWAATPSAPSRPVTSRPTRANHKPVHYCKLSHPDAPGCVDPILAAAKGMETRDRACRRAYPSVPGGCAAYWALEAHHLAAIVERLREQLQLAHQQLADAGQDARAADQRAEDAEHKADFALGVAQGLVSGPVAEPPLMLTCASSGTGAMHFTNCW